MEITTFSKKEAIKFGWETAKKNLGFFIVLLVIIGLISIFWELIEIVTKISPFPDLMIRRYVVVSVIINIILDIIVIIMDLGLIKICLNFYDGLKSKISDLFSQYRLIFKCIGATILWILMVLPGLILFIIPGIYLGIRFQFYNCFIVDQKTGVIESLRRSWQITQGNVWNLFLFGLLLTVINILGLLCLIVGLFITIPTTTIAYIFVYRKLANIQTK